MKYIVYSRYELRTKGGKGYSKWFRRFGEEFDSEAEAKARVAADKKNAADIDKKTKLKHEFEIRCQDETLIEQCKMHAGKGRYKKITLEQLDEIVNGLLKSKDGRYMIDPAIAAYIYNTEAHVDYMKDRVAKHFNGEKWLRLWYDVDDGYKCYVMLKDKD